MCGAAEQKQIMFQFFFKSNIYILAKRQNACWLEVFWVCKDFCFLSFLLYFLKLAVNQSLQPFFFPLKSDNNRLCIEW